jgi:hypothetical protein
MSNNIWFTFSVGDTMRAVSNQYCARQIELVTLNTIHNVAWEISLEILYKFPKPQVS